MKKSELKEHLICSKNELAKAKNEIGILNSELKVYKQKEDDDKINELFKELEKYGFVLESIEMKDNMCDRLYTGRRNLRYTLTRFRY
jgi:hypothetical protein